MNMQTDSWLTTDATPVHEARVLTAGGSQKRGPGNTLEFGRRCEYVVFSHGHCSHST